MGAGGIGGIVAATLTEIGSAVTAVSTNAAIRAAVDRSGFRLIDEGEERVVRGWVSPEPEGRYDLCILATQPPNVEDAARTALPHLADDAQVVVLQNGLCEDRIAAIVGAERVIGGIVAWGASMTEPGRYERTAAGGFAIGRLGSSARGSSGPSPGGRLSPTPNDADLHRVGELLEAIGPVVETQNLRGARWSKLALNCAVSALGTIAGERLGPLVRVRRYRRLALEIMTEVVAVARAEGVALEKVAGTLDLNWVALTDADRAASASVSLTAKHALLLAVGLRYRRMRSSMLAAIERGRTPAIDFLNGEIVSRGGKHELATPFNKRICETVWAIARGQQVSSRATLDRLCGPDERPSGPLEV
ncbi:MAG: ketopantoate reductase family protein [Deltaproteobacteria bacterium]|nr:ketopantoate reductase family protein [Deltaproteobacteria bacterium]MCW5806416.1 ketopantoate reductase family protein [Deltaproteobacteria bacterium]